MIYLWSHLEACSTWLGKLRLWQIQKADHLLWNGFQVGTFIDFIIPKKTEGWVPLPAMPTERTQQRNRTSNAYSLHESVPADRWCVTFSDLNFLRKELQRAIQCGEIQPPADGQDNFHSWAEYGPNIYTVNEQYIKPVTSQAGKMSWALMRNREGLDCDLFISHAWQEGVFEFLAKVRHSWPRGLRHAWCCMLANPQNLNISSFLASPRNSPFAIALGASKAVLVVPNRHTSVYSRLWCGYEAYLAQEEGKTILIAKASHFYAHLHLLLRMAVAAIIGASLGTTFRFLKFHRTLGVPAMTGLACGLSLSIEDNALRLVLNFFSQVLIWIQLTHWLPYFQTSLQGEPREVLHITRQCYWALGSIVLCIMEFDRVHGKSTVREAEELRRGYKGIEHAECSQDADAAKIHREIGNRIGAVDHAIDVLLTAGMSTPTFRDIACAGVNIKSAAFSEITGTILLLGPFGTMAAITATILHILYQGAPWYLAILPSVSVIGRLILVVRLFVSPPDEQCFILKVMSKFMAGMLVFFAIAVVLSFMWRFTTVAFLWLAISDLHLLIMICLAFLGIRGTARLPFGFRLLQLFFNRGQNAFLAWKVCACQSNSDDADTSDSSATDTE